MECNDRIDYGMENKTYEFVPSPTTYVHACMDFQSVGITTVLAIVYPLPFAYSVIENQPQDSDYIKKSTEQL